MPPALVGQEAGNDHSNCATEHQDASAASAGQKSDSPQSGCRSPRLLASRNDILLLASGCVACAIAFYASTVTDEDSLVPAAVILSWACLALAAAFVPEPVQLKRSSSEKDFFDGIPLRTDALRKEDYVMETDIVPKPCRCGKNLADGAPAASELDNCWTCTECETPSPPGKKKECSECQYEICEKCYLSGVDLNILGKGKFSVVRKGLNLVTGETVAIKKVAKHFGLNKGREMRLHLQRELDLLHAARHPNIVRYDGVYEDDKFVYIVTELCDGGELFNIIRDSPDRIGEDKARAIFSLLLNTVAFLHENNICHRDLKLENLVLAKAGDFKSLKLIDFGLSRNVVTPRTWERSRPGDEIYEDPEQREKDVLGEQRALEAAARMQSTPAGMKRTGAAVDNVLEFERNHLKKRSEKQLELQQYREHNSPDALKQRRLSALSSEQRRSSTLSSLRTRSATGQTTGGLATQSPSGKQRRLSDVMEDAPQPPPTPNFPRPTLVLPDPGLVEKEKLVRWSNNASFTPLVGTTEYVAPEILSEKEYSPACDMWSLGVILFVLLSGRRPFASDSPTRLMMRVRNGISRVALTGKEWSGISEEAKDLVMQLMEIDPEGRPTAALALEHPWMNQRQ